MSAPLIYLIAGEASGDTLGGGLMQALHERNPAIRFAGVGGEAMQGQGLNSLFDYKSLSLMGFLEVLPHIPVMLRRLRLVKEDIAKRQPVAVITIDSPGFNFRLARMLKDDSRTQHIQRIHYVAPSVWAYKPQRARKTAAIFDALLTLFPFEPPYFEKEGLSTFCVGHPLLWPSAVGDGAGFRARHGLAENEKLLLVLPGSRVSEVKRHLPVFLEAARRLAGYKVVILAGPQVYGHVRSCVSHEIIVADFTQKQDVFAAAALALSKSGTITLELAVAGVAMIVAHKINMLSAFLLRRMILIKYVSLVNIAAQKEIIPEFLQERCNVRLIGGALVALALPAAMHQQKQACAQALQILRGDQTRNPNEIAAESVLKLLNL